MNHNWPDLSCWFENQHLLLCLAFLLEPTMPETPPFTMFESPPQVTSRKLSSWKVLLGQRIGKAWTCFQWLSFFRTDMRECRTTKDSSWTPWMSTSSSWRGWTAGWTMKLLLGLKWHGSELVLERKLEPSSNEPRSDTMWDLRELRLYVCMKPKWVKRESLEAIWEKGSLMSVCVSKCLRD